MEEEKRNAFHLLDESTRLAVLKLEYHVPILKLLAIEGAR